MPSSSHAEWRNIQDGPPLPDITQGMDSRVVAKAPQNADWDPTNTGVDAGGCDIEEILTRIPHRYPFVLVDRLVQCVPMRSARALKNVSRGEAFFDGGDFRCSHLPQMLVIEAMAQTCALLCSRSVAKPDEALYFFAGIDNCRFWLGVAPGDQLVLEATIVRMSAVFGKLHARALVADCLVAEADFIAMVAQQEERKT